MLLVVPAALQANTGVSAKVTAQLVTNVMMPELKSVVEAGRPDVKHKAVCDIITSALDEPETYGICVADASDCQLLLNPVLQSGGKYNLDYRSAAV